MKCVTNAHSALIIDMMYAQQPVWGHPRSDLVENCSLASVCGLSCWKSSRHPRPRSVVTMPYGRLQIPDGQLGSSWPLHGFLSLSYRRNGCQHHRCLLQLRHRLAERWVLSFVDTATWVIFYFPLLLTISKYLSNIIEALQGKRSNWCVTLPLKR